MVMGMARGWMRELAKSLWVLGLLVALGGCAGPGDAACPSGLQPMTMAELYFGRSVPDGGSVSDAEWPRFPDGLTVEDASGQWKGNAGVVREGAKHLIVMLAGTPGDRAKLDAIRAAYRTRFRQDSVLVFETRGCGAF